MADIILHFLAQKIIPALVATANLRLYSIITQLTKDHV